MGQLTLQMYKGPHLWTSVGKSSACNAGDPGSIPGLGKSPGEGNGNPLQYSCLQNSMDRGAWWAKVHGVSKSQTGLKDYTFFLLWGNRILPSLHFTIKCIQLSRWLDQPLALYSVDMKG